MRGARFRLETRRLLRLAWPIIVSQLGQVGMNTADTIMVGPLGAVSLAAAGLGSAIHWLVILPCIGVLVGLSPIVSQAFGSGDLRACHRALVQGLWLAFLLSAPITLSSLVGEPLARALGQDAEVSRLTGEYLFALAWGILPFFLFTAIRQYLEGMGRTTVPMIITFLGLAINIPANALLIYGVDGRIPALGVAGSGWATTIVRWFMFFAAAAYLLASPLLRAHRGEPMRPDAALIRRVLRIGVPIGGQFGLEVGLFSFAAVMMGWLGPLELAAHQVTINIASTTFMVALGVSLAGSIRVGQCIGARRPARMRRAALATYALAVTFMAVCALTFVVLPHELIGLYTRDPPIIDLGVRLLLVAAAFQVFDGAQVAGVSVLRGGAETRSAAAIAAIGYWAIGLPVAWMLAFAAGLGPVGVWLGLTVGLFVAGILLAVRARRLLWHTPIGQLRTDEPTAR
ncbi:MAG: MATE family efflux transporter [Gemmatimonadetes bacterium]|nr:MATE family efflux transporter [Gemmatimonadota bacterium]